MMRPTILLATLFAATAFAQQPTEGKQPPSREQAAPAMQDEDPLTPYANKQHIQEWRAKNPWFGSDSSKTEFALNYARQLRTKNPELTGRPFLNAVSARVKKKFGP